MPSPSAPEKKAEVPAVIDRRYSNHVLAAVGC